MRVKADAEPGSSPSHRDSFRPPPQDHPEYHQQAENEANKMNDGASGLRGLGCRAWIGDQVRMELMNVADDFLRRRRTRGPAENMAVALADEHRAPIVQLHDMRQIRLAKNMDDRHAGGSKALLDRLNQLRLGQDMEADLDVVETGMRPVFDIV